MSNDSDDLHRVRIRKRKGFATIESTFRLGVPGASSVDPIARKLLELAHDWTMFSIADMQFAPMLSSAGHSLVDQTVSEDVITFLSRTSIGGEEVEVEDGAERVMSFVIHDDDLQVVAKKLETTTQMMTATVAMQRSTLGALISEFDYFFSRLLGIVSEFKPQEFYDGSETITLAEAQATGSVDAILASRVAKTIQKKLRMSHSDYIDWAMGAMGVAGDIASYKKSAVYKEFLELCQRRHLLMHAGGIVNQEYIDRCAAAGIAKSDLPKIGSRVAVDRKYMMRAAARVYLTGYFILQLCLQKNFPESRVASYRSMLSTSHEFLCVGLTKMCERVCDFAEFSKKDFDQELRLKFGINRALSKLLDPSLERDEQTEFASQVLDKYDWSVTNPIFELATACVRREFSEIIGLAKSAASAGLSYSEARTFVVFREAREIEGFLDCFPRAALLIDGPKPA